MQDVRNRSHWRKPRNPGEVFPGRDECLNNNIVPARVVDQPASRLSPPRNAIAQHTHVGAEIVFPNCGQDQQAVSQASATGAELSFPRLPVCHALEVAP